MDINKEGYQKMVSEAMPHSKVLRDCTGAFLVGGTICMLGEVLTKLWSLIPTVTPMRASLLTTMSLILLSGILTGIGVYDRISRIAGAGTLVPITGFANAVVSPALEFKSEGYVLGTGAKMFTIAGPVIVYGTAASVVAGGIYFILKELLI